VWRKDIKFYCVKIFVVTTSFLILARLQNERDYVKGCVSENWFELRLLTWKEKCFCVLAGWVMCVLIYTEGWMHTWKFNYYNERRGFVGNIILKFYEHMLKAWNNKWKLSQETFWELGWLDWMSTAQLQSEFNTLCRSGILCAGSHNFSRVQFRLWIESKCK